jgi:glucose/arabinose dehydrogenase
MHRHQSNAIVLSLALSLTATAAHAVVPTGFVDEPVVAGLDRPSGIAFLPDGRLLVVEQKSSRIRLVVDDVLSTTDPVGIVPTVNTTGNERGLLGIAVDPEWPARPYVYVHYTSASPAAGVRISRFTLTGDLDFSADGALTLDAASRHDVLTGLPDAASNHNGGTVRFGTDGMLYVTLGDDASGCAAQDTTSLRGVILRLDVSALPAGAGGPPARTAIAAAGNPFETHPNANARLVWALGLRNPFRLQIDVSTGALLVADVGENEFEELSIVSSGGGNLGWPYFEAFEPFADCGGVPASLVDPIFAYAHTQTHAIIPAAFLRVGADGVAFPAEYDGDVLFTDYYDGALRRLTLQGGNWVIAAAVPGQPNAGHWANGFGEASDFLVGPDGALWVCRQSIAFQINTGQIRRIRHTEITGVGEDGGALAFAAPRPNPASGDVALRFVLPRAGRARLALFDASGRRVRRIVDADLAAGAHERWWDGRDDAGRAVADGVYFAVLEAAGGRAVRRVLRLN